MRVASYVRATQNISLHCVRVRYNVMSPPYKRISVGRVVDTTVVNKIYCIYVYDLRMYTPSYGRI